MDRSQLFNLVKFFSEMITSSEMEKMLLFMLYISSLVMWKQFSLDVGYAPIGIRSDDARTDLPSTSGNTSDSFETHPTIAWLIALGGTIPIGSTLDIFIKVEYRVRYYNKRSGENLEGDINLGTQSIAPIIGVAWQL